MQNAISHASYRLLTSANEKQRICNALTFVAAQVHTSSFDEPKKGWRNNK